MPDRAPPAFERVRDDAAAEAGKLLAPAVCRSDRQPGCGPRPPPASSRGAPHDGNVSYAAGR